MSSMANWIGFTMALLGAVLVLAGASLIFLHARGQLRPAADPYGEQPTVASTPDPAAPGLLRRLLRGALSLPDAHHLIAWGLVLLVLGALASGALRFGFAVELGTFNADLPR